MSEFKVTVDDLLDKFRQFAETGTVVSPDSWMRDALHLNSFLAEESDKLITLEHEYAVIKRDILNTQSKTNVTLANAIAETRPEFVAMRKQKSKVDRIKEHILLAKKYASINNY